MAAVLKLIGWLVMIGSASLLVLIAINRDDVILALPWAIALMFTGIVIMVFARVLSRIHAIRVRSDHQTEIIGDLARRGGKDEPTFTRNEPW